MQLLLPQLSKTRKAYLDKYAQEVAQEGLSNDSIAELDLFFKQ